MKKLLSMVAILMLVNVFGCGEDPVINEDVVVNIEDSTVGEEEVVEEEIDIELEEDISTLEAIIADETADSSDCATLTDEELKKTCEQKFIYDKAVTDKDKDMCGELENTADQEMCVAEVE